MLTYFARPRGLYTDPDGAAPSFPCRVEVSFVFEPGTPFGGSGATGRTVPLGSNVRSSWNACKGETRLDTDARIVPVDVEFSGQDAAITFRGPVMTVTTRCNSRGDLESLLCTYYYALPASLAIDFIDVPVIAEVRGVAGDVSFCWGLLKQTGSLDAVTTPIQEKRIASAYDRLKLIDEGESYTNRRLLGALQYFHIACRLSRLGERWCEFLSEALLNLAKVLEVLFPGPPGQSMDAARQGLNDLGYSESEIEALFIPALALRNAVDVAHPTVAVLSAADAATLHQYAELAEDSIRELLRRIFERLAAGSYHVKAVPNVSPSADTLGLISRLKHNLAEYANARGRAQAPPGHNRGTA